MNTSHLQSFASNARNQLMNAVAAQLEIALAPNSAARVDSPTAFEQLETEIRSSGGGDVGKNHVVERYAYRWFNRIIAFRYMDVHGFTATPVVSAVNLIDPNGLPEILAAAKRGEYDETVFGVAGTGNAKLRDHIEDLFNGVSQAEDPQGRAYGLLLQAQCRYWNKFMPFMFENTNSINGKVDELLMPADLLAEGSALRNATLAMTPEDCGAGCGSDSDNKGNVEIIGWLYQFYIAERKHEVMAGFDRGKKAGKDEIPAATQLFTPDWIVRYLVQNTVGRLWMQNHPDCRLSEDWDYYIPPSIDRANDGDKDLFLSVDSPEELTVCDPACGSGHMLTYAFDLLYSIYEDEGYSPSEIPGLILQHNLFGMEIDERAANLAAFALTMKARSRSRQFFRHQMMPHIQCITPEYFTDEEVTELNKLYDVTLDASTWNAYQHADIYGSLIQPDAELATVSESITNIESSSLFDESLVERGNQVLTQTAYLASQYAAVVANPPYMGSGNMGDLLKKFAMTKYASSKYDLYSMFIEKISSLSFATGLFALIAQDSWLSQGSYDKYREWIIDNISMFSLVHTGTDTFESITGKVVSTAFFVGQRSKAHIITNFYELQHYSNALKPDALVKSIHNENSSVHFQKMISCFKKIPHTPFIYSASNEEISILEMGPRVGDFLEAREGMATGNNNEFLRYWYEVSLQKIAINDTNIRGNNKQLKYWFPYQKGGTSRRWYGNNDYVVNWFNDGESIRNNKEPSTGRTRSHNYNGEYALSPGLTWSSISGNDFAVRHVCGGYLFDAKGPMAFAKRSDCLLTLEAFLNSSVAAKLMRILAPRLDFKLGHVLSLPVRIEHEESVDSLVRACVDAKKELYDLNELSIDFIEQIQRSNLNLTITAWMSQEQSRIKRLLNSISLNERSLNQKIQLAYSELSIDNTSNIDTENVVPSIEELTYALISYAVGCMFGRYSLDKPGLILASQGETLDDYYAQIPNPSFEPDKDNVIPVTGVDCFEDDIVSRFRIFLEVTFGKENLAENIAYIQSVLGKDLGKYFVNDFYNDHVKMYKNRPIYWQYSSRTDNKGSFKALVYLHRYTPKTNGTVLGYLRDYTSRITGIAEHSEKSDRTQDKRASEKLHKAVAECKAYEDQTLYPLATRNLEIDLDDGVLVNYLRLGNALRKIPAIEKKRKDVESWTWPHYPLVE